MKRERTIVPAALALGGCLVALGANVPLARRTVDTLSMPPVALAAGDFNADGHRDLAVATASTIVVELNNGQRPPSFMATFGGTANTITSIGAADLDDDGDLDLASTSSADHTLAWYENDGMDPPSFTKRVISQVALLAGDLAIGDLEPDGDLDIVVAITGGNVVWGYLNNGAANPALALHPIATGAAGVESVALLDLEGDGDLDVVEAEPGDGQIVWLENDGMDPPGFTTALTAAMGSMPGVDDLAVGDIDGDGIDDVIAAIPGANRIAVFEVLLPGPSGYSTYNVVTGYTGLQRIDATDVDGDGDVDVLATGTMSSPHAVAWFDSDGAGTPTQFTVRQTAFLDDYEPVIGTDMDGDGDTEIVAGAFGFAFDVHLWENRTKVLNITQDRLYDSVSVAFDNAGHADEIRVSPERFAAEPTLAFPARPLVITGYAEITQPVGGLYTLSNDSTLSAAPGRDMTLAGTLRPPVAGDASLSADDLLVTVDGALDIGAGTRLGVATEQDSEIRGDTTLGVSALLAFSSGVDFTGTMPGSGSLAVGPGAALSVAGSASSSQPISILGGSISCSGSLAMTETLDGFGILDSNVINHGEATFVDDSDVTGNYTNNDMTIVQNGRLTVLGSMINNGTIIGLVVGGMPARSHAPGFFVAGDLAAGTAASMMLDPGATVSVGGAFDVSINANTRCEMDQAELRLVGLGPVQPVEAMSRDIGPRASGLDRTNAGHYPLGTLRVGPTPTTVDLADARDNDGLGQGDREAIYASSVVVDAGATLNTQGHRVYYETLVLDGAVDNPANLIPICAVDLDLPYGVLDFFDVLEYLALFDADDPLADFAPPFGVWDFFDVLEFLGQFDAGCP